MWSDGQLTALSMWERRTAGTESSSSATWPTPTAQTGGDGQRPDGFRRLLGPEVRRREAQMWPTPCAADGKDEASGDLYARVNQVGRQAGKPMAPFWTPDANCWKGGNRGNQINQQVPGSLNPTWVEWLMGYEIGYTVCEHSATPSSRSKPTPSSGPSQSTKD
jgi:hypothetical protein